MEALTPQQTPALSKESSKLNRSKKSFWSSVKQVFEKTPETPKKDYSNFTTVKLLPEMALTLDVQKRIPEHQHIVYRNLQQFDNINDFTDFLRDTKPLPQTLQAFHKILSANAPMLIKRNSKGKTPLRVAVETNNCAAVEFILSDLVHYIDPYHEIHHQLVLFKAIENQNLRLIELMLQPGFIIYGEQLKMTNEKGKNAAEYALEIYKKAPLEHKKAAWSVAYLILPDALTYPPDFSS